jgi:hypothetical protein
MANDIEQDLFFVRRNTNRSEVHYQISAAGTEPITVFEQMAFGIARQRVEGSGVFFSPDCNSRARNSCGAFA